MDFDLQKKASAVNKILLTKGIKNAPIMRCAVALDISFSMSDIIGRGDLQRAFNQIMGVAVKFDDNGELDVFKFDTACDYVGTSKPVAGDYDVFVNKRGINVRGGTSYAPIVKAARAKFFGGGFLGFGKGDNTPVLMMILTDGEPGDASATMAAMKASADANEPIYYHMVGIGGTRDKFPTIARLADALPNVGEVYMPKFPMPDEQVFDQLICDELVQWVGKFAPSAQATA